MNKSFFILAFLVTYASLSAADGSLQDMVSAAGIKENFSLAAIFGAIIFGSVGIFGFLYGKRKSNPVLMVIGVVLMAYPYIVKDTTLIYVVGGVLSLSLYFFRR